MTILCRIKTNGRAEKEKWIFSKKHESFDWDGDTYQLDASKAYLSRGRLLTLYQGPYTLDYIKGQPEPLDYFTPLSTTDEEEKVHALTPRTVAQTYKRIIETVDPLYLLIGIIAAILIGIVALYFAYDAGGKADMARYWAESTYRLVNGTRAVKP